MNLYLHLKKHWRIHLVLVFILQLPRFFEVYVQFPQNDVSMRTQAGFFSTLLNIIAYYSNLYIYILVSKKILNGILTTIIFSILYTFIFSLLGIALFEFITMEFVSKSIFIFLNLLLIIGLYSILEKLDTDKYLGELLLKNKENELKVLKNQVNPHFLMNTLNNIYATVYKKDEVSGDLILQLSGLLRYSFSAIDKENVFLKEEISYLEQYIQLEEIRLNDTNINFYKNVSNPQLLIAPLLFISLVENAFKHGLSEDIEASWLTIDLKQNNQGIDFKISNSLPNIERTTLSYGSGISNLKKRLALLYPNRHAFSIKEKDATFKVSLTITL